MRDQVSIKTRGALTPNWKDIPAPHCAATEFGLGCLGISHSPSSCVAGVALMALGGALGPVLVARDAVALCVAGVALGDIHLRFTWQAWHHLTPTLVLRGGRGAHGTGWRAWARFSRA